MAEKKETAERKETQEKDWRLVEVENLRGKFRLARGILFWLFSISIVAFLISCFTLPLRPVVLYFFPALFFSFFGWYATRAFKIAKAWENLVFFWRDDHSRTEGPGWYCTLPPLEKVKFGDVREREVNIEPQEIITKDQITIKLDASAWYTIVDLASYYLNIKNPEESIQKLLMGGLRIKGGEMSMDEIITDQQQLIRFLRDVLEEEIKKAVEESVISTEEEGEEEETIRSRAGGIRKKGWGVKITRVTIPMLERPKEIADAVHEKIAAKEKKEAMILIAKGEAGGIERVKESLKEGTGTENYIGLQFVKNLEKNAKYFFDLEKIPFFGKVFKNISK